MMRNKDGWTHVILGASMAAALFAGLGAVAILTGLKDRRGRTLDANTVWFLAGAGALIGGINSWRTGRATIIPHRRRATVTQAMTKVSEARRGSADQAKVARQVAIATVIPAAIAGLLVGTRWVEPSDSAATLLWVCSAAAFGAGFGALLLVWTVYRVFGFGPVAALAYVLLGGYYGFLLGAVLSRLTESWWPLLLAPLGAAAGLAVSRISPSLRGEGTPDVNQGERPPTGSDPP